MVARQILILLVKVRVFQSHHLAKTKPAMKAASNVAPLNPKVL